MQFHLDGFRGGDPEIRPAALGRGNDSDQGSSDVADVLIVGAGPAGLLLAAQLAEFPSISTRVIERRDGPLVLGQADGVACRTVEMFQAFGLGEKLTREACWVNETVFWGPDAEGGSGIVRKGRVPDVEEGLSEAPHVIVNQARLQDYLVERMANSPSRVRPEYGVEVTAVEHDLEDSGPVTVCVRRTAADGTEMDETLRARYVVGCDGARSVVRKSLGLELKGDPQNHAWGVLDVLGTTNFPDIRFKAVIQSQSAGNLGVIPREGGYLVRLYVDLGEISPGDQTLRDRVGPDQIIETARRVLAPYTLDVKELPWWSVYEVGQRLTDRFDDVPDEERGRRAPRVFIAGDACHTHSAKAGQGMNVSMQDAFNLGWKLAAVIRGASPSTLLDTYSAERQPIAQELIDFDRRFAQIIGGRPKAASGEPGDGVDPAEIQAAFTAAGRFTAGVATRYPASLLIGGDAHQRLATGYPVGMRFHSAPVVRLADAKPIQLGHVHEADGRWRLYAFADAAPVHDATSRVRQLCDYLTEDSSSPLRRYTAPSGDVDAVFDVRAVFQQHHHESDPEQLPALLLPTKGALGLKDYEKAFTAPVDGGQDIFDLRGIDRNKGALVVVRPDQYVAHVLPLDAYDELGAFFGRFMCPMS